MRLIIYGAGAVGGTIGARAFAAGHEVVLIARGAHFDAIRAAGLTYSSPDGTSTLGIPVVDRPGAVDWRPGDVTVIAMKSQHTEAALRDLRAAAPDTAVVCAQNGVANERFAARLFRAVYGMCVQAPCLHLEPGVVVSFGAPYAGLLDLGSYPHGVDDVAAELAAVLVASGFASRPVPDVMRWKYRKLTRNLGNSIEVLCGTISHDGELTARAVEEAEEVFAVAGIDVASPSEESERRGASVEVVEVPGHERVGGSTRQSVLRGADGVETDYLNGEIVLLGRLSGVPTPVNELLQREAANVVTGHAEPGGWTEARLLERLAQTARP